MPDPDRSAELLRQRALIREHLAWLDREIADAENGTVPSPSVNRPGGESEVGQASEAPFPDPASRHGGMPLPIESAQKVEAEAEALMAESRLGAADLERDVRKGCFLYFAAALALLAATVTVLYFALKR